MAGSLSALSSLLSRPLLNAAMHGSRGMNSDVMKEMQNAISHASMMREARADDKSDILSTQHKAAAAAAMFLNSRLPGVHHDQSSGIPDLSGQKR